MMIIKIIIMMMTVIVIMMIIVITIMTMTIIILIVTMIISIIIITCTDDICACAVLTLRPVFSSRTNLPSAAHSLMATGPLALFWYVVLADISPRTTWLALSEESTGSGT